MKNLIFTLFTVAFLSVNAYAQVGTLDKKFNTKGFATTAITTGNDLAHSIAVQSDGKILQAGESFESSSFKSCTVIRYNTDGTLDKTFGTDGVSTIDLNYKAIDLVYKVIVNKSGKIYLAGFREVFSKQNTLIIRLNSNGTLDKTFNNTGIENYIFDSSTVPYDMIVDELDNIYLAGFSLSIGIQSPFVIKLDSKGDFTSFGNFISYASLSTQNGNAIASWMLLKSDGKVLVTGYSSNGIDNDFYVAQLNADGSTDDSFGTKGLFIKDFGGNDNSTRIAFQGKKIVACGYSDKSGTSDFVAYRLNENGTIDNTFGTNGYTTIPVGSGTDQCFSIMIQPDNKIVLAGFGANASGNNDVAIARLDANGKLDATFASAGKALIPIGTLNDIVSAGIFDKDGSIILSGRTEITTGNYDFMISKIVSGYNVGILDFNNLSNQVLVFPNPFQNSISVDFELNTQENLTFELLDAQGKLIQKLAINTTKEQGKHKETFEVNPALSNGLYILSINNGSKQQHIKLIK